MVPQKQDDASVPVKIGAEAFFCDIGKYVLYHKNALRESHCGGKVVCRKKRPAAGGESRKRDSLLRDKQ